uniref:Uncharacterized protein n=1 Tax=Arundo donax TaxID=35708 RepID=A0A0A8ZAM0_ARUDO
MLSESILGEVMLLVNAYDSSLRITLFCYVLLLSWCTWCNRDSL